MWSLCSCVTRMAVIDDGSSPRRARRRTASFTPNPQSISTQVPPAWTTSPLPSLPLPSDAKRIAPRRLLQLILEQRENLLAVGAFVRRAVGVLHGDETVRIGLRD